MTHIPHRNSKSKVSHPYITKKITRQMDKRDRLYKKAIRTRSQHDWETYKTKRNSVQRLKELAHNEYLNDVVGESLLSDPKKFWRYVKAQRRESAGIPTLKVEGKMYSTNEDKAKALNTQFSSVFTRDNNTSVLPDKGHSPYEPIENLLISSPGVNKQLNGLKINKASGPDELPARMLRDYADEITPLLTHLYQQSYDNGVLPKDWLRARVASIYKSGDKSDPSNYRPVSLTCICCKILEHIILSHMSKFLAKNDIITPNQHGFRRGRSCDTQLVEAVKGT